MPFVCGLGVCLSRLSLCVAKKEARTCSGWPFAQAARADGRPLEADAGAGRNGHVVRSPANGDCLVTIRHDGCREVTVEGDDPQELAEDDGLEYEGAWSSVEFPRATAGRLGKPFDLEFAEVQPHHGTIAIRFFHRQAGEAMVQAIEVAPE